MRKNAPCVPSAWFKRGPLRCTSMDSKGIYPSVNIPPATFQSAALPRESFEYSNLPKGSSIFLTQHVSRQTGSGVSPTVEASYNSNSRGIFVGSIITHPQYYTAVLSTFPSSAQKTNTEQLSNLVPILPSVSTTLLERSCLLSYVLLHANPLSKYSCNSSWRSLPEVYLPSFHTQPFHYGTPLQGKREIYMVQR